MTQKKSGGAAEQNRKQKPRKERLRNEDGSRLRVKKLKKNPAEGASFEGQRTAESGSHASADVRSMIKRRSRSERRDRAFGTVSFLFLSSF